MTSRSIQALKNKKVEVMLVDKELAEEIRNLKTKLNTSSLDVVSAGLELLKMALNNEVVFREPETGRESKITVLSKLTS